MMCDHFNKTNNLASLSIRKYFFSALLIDIIDFHDITPVSFSEELGIEYRVLIAIMDRSDSVTHEMLNSTYALITSNPTYGDYILSKTHHEKKS